MLYVAKVKLNQLLLSYTAEVKPSKAARVGAIVLSG